MNKNILIVIAGAVVLLVIGFLVFKQPTSVRNYPPKDGPIVAFGDSLVSGSGATEDNDFVSILSRKLGEPIENFGVPGDTTADALARVDAAIEKAPRIVLVLLGGNDFLRRISKEQTFSNLRAIIGKFQDSGAVVILIGVRTGLLFDGSGSEFKQLASDTKSGYVSDVLDGLFGNPKYMADQIHPNDEGYLVIAGRIYSELIRFLR